MRARPVAPFLALVLAAGFAGPADAARSIPVETGVETDRYIVALAPGTEPARVTSRLGIRGVGAQQTFRHALNGFAAGLTPSQREALRRDPSVRAVVPDTVVTLEDQLLPTGVDRAEGDRSPTAAIDGVENHVDADVAIIDTGIQRGHPDLNVVGGVSCVPGTPSSSWDDIGSHGTHVAGIVGARDNGIGVVGMAPGVRLWAVRVFDDTHKGHLSQIICGIDWATAQRDPADPTRPRIEAVNMSLSTPGTDDGACGTTNDDLEHQAICRSVAAGITYVVAAGNQETNAATRVPAAYDEVITVGALADFNGKPGGGAPSTCSSFDSADLDDTYADFSNYGADVDIMAPGKCILSTVPGNTYDFSTGTSMATPAVAGGAALYLATHPDASPREVRSALIAAGSTDWLTSTDPDGVPQRLLDVSSFGAAPGFSVALRPGVRAVGTDGGTARYAVDIVRRNGFAEAIDLKLGSLPVGVRGSLTVARSAGLDSISSSASLQIAASTADDTYPVTITGTAGSLTQRAEATLDVGVPDTAPPVVRAPVAAFALYSTVAWDGSTSGIPVGLRWSATDARSAISRYDLDHAIDGAAWQNVALPSAASTSLQVSLVRGRRYAYRVSAVDAAGNHSPEATAPSFEPVPHQESSSAVTYSSGWSTLSSSSAWGGTIRTTRTRGAWARFTFTGKAIAIIAPRGTGRGRAEILIDGNVVGSFDLTSRTAMVRRVVFTRTWTTNATRVLVIRNLATADRPRLDIDGFVFLR